MEKSNQDRINNTMVFESDRAICPNCGFTVYPKFYNHFLIGDSGMRWCNHCFKGKARFFWRYIENENI